MAGTSLVAALVVNFTIGVIKMIVGLLTGSAAMISESYHSFADTFNQILLALGIRRSKKEPDEEHPFGYSKVQFFWAFVVAVLIFGISGTFAFSEGLSIIQHPEEHKLNKDLFVWNLVVLGIAIILEGFALATAYKEAKKYQVRYKSDSIFDTLTEMQDPVLLALLVEDSLALVGLLIAFVGSTITYVTDLAIVDGITSLLIGIVLMTGGLLLARENRTYLVGKSVSSSIQKDIKSVLESFPGIDTLVSMKTMQLGTDDMILVLDVKFTTEVEKDDVAEYIDKIEQSLSAKVPMLSPEKIFIEAQ